MNKTASPYYQALAKCGHRYGLMCLNYPHLFDEAFHSFTMEFRKGVSDRLPLMKLNRWLGYIQATVIHAGLTTVEAERDWTRPLFRPIDFDPTITAERQAMYEVLRGWDTADLMSRMASVAGHGSYGRDILEADMDAFGEAVIAMTASKAPDEIVDGLLRSLAPSIAAMDPHTAAKEYDAKTLAENMIGFASLVARNACRMKVPPCTCETDLESDAYGPGGPMSGKPVPPPCKAHPNATSVTTARERYNHNKLHGHI